MKTLLGALRLVLRSFGEASLLETVRQVLAVRQVEQMTALLRNLGCFLELPEKGLQGLLNVMEVRRRGARRLKTASSLHFRCSKRFERRILTV